MASEQAKRMRATAEELVMSFNGDWTSETANAAVAGRAPDCVHTMLPTSLGIPSRSNEEWVEYFKNLHGLVTDCKMKIHDVIVAVEERRVVIYSSQNCNTSVGPFANEYTWIFTFDQAGEKITRIDEMIDTAATKDLLARRAAAAN